MAVGNVQAADLVTITQVFPAGRSQRCHMVGDDTPGGGAARWDVVERPRRRSLPMWAGTDLATLVLPLKLDGFNTLPAGGDVSVEGICDWFATFQVPTSVTGIPPILTVSGPLRLPPYRPWWYVAGIEWGDQVRGADGSRIQQDVTVTLGEWQTAAILKGPAAAARAKAGK